MRDPETGGYSNYGYDLYIPNAIRAYAREEEGFTGHDTQVGPLIRELSPVFMAAAWELCRLGILRPGIKRYGEQATTEGNGGNGYSITPFGEAWLEEADDHFIPTQPDTFARLLDPFRERLGPGFYQRAQEAVRCRLAGTNLASCAMCGAAAESILLAVAIAKVGDEDKVLKDYRTAQGRNRVQKLVLGQAPERLARPFRSFTDLLDYWRDEAGHGQASDISEFEAY